MPDFEDEADLELELISFDELKDRVGCSLANLKEAIRLLGIRSIPSVRDNRIKKWNAADVKRLQKKVRELVYEENSNLQSS